MHRWLACLIFWLAATAEAADRNQRSLVELPVPAGLDADVGFWEKIFVKYTPEQCVFHDKTNLNVVYLAKKIPGATPSSQMRNIRRYLGAIRAGLKHLAYGGEPRNLLERRLVEATPANARFPATYRNGIDNVRCQRGVDLGPSLLRSRQHVGMVKRILSQKGLPADLAYLPHLESGYHLQARSKAGARGLWQLMPATARLQGLRVSRTYDQRTSAQKSTLAAAAFLKELHASTGSWPLAITAYNYGKNGMARAIRQWGTDYMTIRENHRTRIFGFAARNYYPSFLAVRNIASGGGATSEPVALDTTSRGVKSL